MIVPQTQTPNDVDNQSDYFGVHYPWYGLSAKAICNPDLLFLFFAFAVHGKVNDICAFHRRAGLPDRLEALSLQYCIIGNNLSPLSERILMF